MLLKESSLDLFEIKNVPDRGSGCFEIVDDSWQFNMIHGPIYESKIDRLGPDILLALWMKGQVLHRARAHLKVPG